MDKDKKLETSDQDLFVRYADEITPANQRAGREALLKHKQAGNSVAVSRNGKVVILPPDEIEID
jgi:hypothetical protein